MFQRGPLFHNVLLADEVNRAPAKVQSALLEAMGERQITLGRTTYKLPPLFLIMATQNPIEQEGTYPLPEAQLDRFLLYVRIDYPTGDAERAILRLARDEAHRSLEAHGEATEVTRVTAQAIFDARREVLDMHLSQALERYLVELVPATRTPARYGDDLARWIAFGASPRASIALVSIRARPRMAGWPRLRGPPRHTGDRPRRAQASGVAQLRCRGRWHRPGPRGRRAAVEGGGPVSSTGEARGLAGEVGGLSGATFSSADLAGLRARAAGLSLNAHRSNRSGRAGTRLSRFRGRGMEYSESRMYLPGDDIRSIDWRVTARTGRVHTKLFHEERDRPALFVVDLGEQMRFGTRRAFKSVVAAETASLRAPARCPRRRRPARHQRRLMEDLRRRIDGMAARECPPVATRRQPGTDLALAKRAIADRAPRSTERPLRLLFRRRPRQRRQRGPPLARVPYLAAECPEGGGDVHRRSPGAGHRSDRPTDREPAPQGAQVLPRDAGARVRQVRVHSDRSGQAVKRTGRLRIGGGQFVPDGHTRYRQPATRHAVWTQRPKRCSIRVNGSTRPRHPDRVLPTLDPR